MDYWTHSATAHAGDPDDPEAGRIPSRTNRTKTGGPVINGGLDLHVGGLDFGTAGSRTAVSALPPLTLGRSE